MPGVAREQSWMMFGTKITCMCHQAKSQYAVKRHCLPRLLQKIAQGGFLTCCIWICNKIRSLITPGLQYMKAVGLNRGEKKDLRWLGSNVILLPTLGITGSKTGCRKKEIMFNYKERVQEIKNRGSFKYRFTNSKLELEYCNSSDISSSSNKP